MTRLFLGILLMLMVSGCVTDLGAPLHSEEDTPILSSELDEAHLTFQEIDEQSIVVGYPAGWAINGGEVMVYIAPDENELPWGEDYSLTNPRFYLYAKGSYTNRSNRRTHIPQSAAAVLASIPINMNGKVLQPITSVDVAGRDGATYLVGNDFRHIYTVVVRVTPHKAVVLTAEGPAEESEEMQSILNAMALNVRPIE